MPTECVDYLSHRVKEFHVIYPHRPWIINGAVRSIIFVCNVVSSLLKLKRLEGVVGVGERERNQILLVSCWHAETLIWYDTFSGTPILVFRHKII